jgi:phenylpyruvate tautomerase PptA (4-oxalocrotonate tautomerase family)
MQTENNLSQEILKSGLILGALQIVLSMSFYLMDVSLLLGMNGMAVRMLFIIFAIIFLGLRTRASQNGLLTFADAFKTIFLIGFVGMAMDSTLLYILYNFVDTSLEQQTREIAIETTQEMLQKFNAPAEQVEKAIEQVENKNYSYTIGKMIQSIIVSGIFGAIFSAIVAAIIKKESKTF